MSSAEQKSSAEQETQIVGALEDPSKVKLIGYDEFYMRWQAEREYWVSVDVPKLPNPLKAGQMSLQQDQSLCVEHVQYNGKLAESSAISRVSIRPTRSMELRSHLDKCVPCRSCKQRQDCKQCQRCRSIKQLCAPCKSASADRCPKCWGLCDECKACRRPTLTSQVGL